MLQLPPLSLYIHIPWCYQKCPYCDFNSHGKTGTIPQQAYVSALLMDLARDHHYIQGRKLHSIFIGGGTPSLFDAHHIKKLLDGIGQQVDCEPNIEITMEANPGTVEHDDLALYRAAGITRLSIGVQSFADCQLNLLGRIHDKDQAKNAIIEAKKANYHSINVDLMHGLPKQSVAAAMMDLDSAAALAPPHLSWYQLTIEPNTLFHSQPPQLPDDDTLWQIYRQGQQLLAQHGYRQYEISAYAKEGHQCKHNINYWQFGDYLGIGCGAHGKITVDSSQKIWRTLKIKHPKGYLEAIDPLFAKTEVLAADRPIEYLMNRFRLISPLAKQEFESKTGLKPDVISFGMEKAADKGLVSISDTHWQLTARGRLFTNTLLEQFFP